jgi:SAM-dependent methyltransferase
MDTLECDICGNSNKNTSFSFYDYNLGNSHRFSYFQCSACGCLQKENPDEDNSMYYPNNYYSFSKDDQTTISSKVKWLIRDLRNAYYRTGKGALGEFIHKILPGNSVAMINKINPPLDSKILDVGCGSESLMLQYLASRGYQYLTGIDPYISMDHVQIKNAHIYKKDVFEISDKFDVITFNYSYEHMRRQKEILLHCNKILSNSGQLILTIPIVDSYAWETFKEFWPNLDAPRHLFLHSLKSITLLAEKCGFSIKSTYFDSTPFQFWGKKLYERKIPLFSSNKSHQMIRLWLRLFYSFVYYKKVQYLNQTSKGDLIVLILQKKDIAE